MLFVSLRRVRYATKNVWDTPFSVWLLLRIYIVLNKNARRFGRVFLFWHFFHTATQSVVPVWNFQIKCFLYFFLVQHTVIRARCGGRIFRCRDCVHVTVASTTLHNCGCKIVPRAYSGICIMIYARCFSAYLW